MERGSVEGAFKRVAGAVILMAWVGGIVTLITLVSLGYLWPGEVPPGFIAWLGGVLMLGGLAVHGLFRSAGPARPPADRETDDGGRALESGRELRPHQDHG